MGHLQKESQEILRLAIESVGLNHHTKGLLEVARESIRIVATDNLEKLSIGESRIGGPPDLESKLQWPLYSGEDTKNNDLSVFYFQVNLTDLPNILAPSIPEKGLLSIYSTSQNQLEDEGSVLYFNDINTLHSQRLPNINEFGDKDLDNKYNIAACFHQPRKLEFELSVSLPGYLYHPEFIEEDELDAYLELESLLTHKLKGEEIGFMFSHYLQGMPEEDDPKWFTLFNLSSGSQYFSFGDCGNCGISIKRDKEKVCDFEGAHFCYCE